MAKWDYLFEADDPLKRALRKAAEENDPQAYFRAMARVRGSRETVDRWDELQTLNAEAKRGFTREEALEWVRKTLRAGFAVVLRKMTSPSVNVIININIFTDFHTPWYVPGNRDAWTTPAAPTSVYSFVNSAYDRNDMVAGYVDYLRTVPHRRAGLIRSLDRAAQRAKPLFAAIPFSALPNEIRQQLDDAKEELA